MSNYYRRLLRNIFIVIFMIFGGISFFVYNVFEDYAVLENKTKVRDLLMHNKALRIYIEQTLKPTIYKFQQDNILDADYFDPKILSSTYISRHVMEEYNNQREKQHLKKYIYKIASDNPRNSINQANTKEKELLSYFNESNTTSYSKHIVLDKQRYMYYAMPVPKTKESCLRCHSTPEKAPKNLVERYGSKAGFYEKMGRSRAIVSLTIPLEQDVKNMQKLYNSFVLSLSIVFVIILLVIYFAIKILDKKDRKLQDRTELDGLTDIYNRYKFNKDIEIFTSSQRESEKFHLIMLDIDHFKNINDNYGHAVGDMVLRELCSLISKNIRPTDKFYRVGGEEFTIISFSNTDKTELEFANKINKLVQDHHFTKVQNITISIGFTKCIDGESSIDLYERCDKALYSAKENGRNRIEIC